MSFDDLDTHRALLEQWMERAAQGDGGPGWAAATEQLCDSAMGGEATYNRAKPVRLAGLLMGGAPLLSLVAWRHDSRAVGLAATAALLAGFAVMT